MSFFIWWINLSGLILTIFGSSMLFFGTPRDTPDLPDVQPTPLDRVLHPVDITTEFKKLNKRKGMSKLGFGLLWIGFILQLVPQFFQYPTHS